MRDRIIEDLLMLHKVFSECGIRFFMQEGNSLGIGRFQDIMENDTDIDIGVADVVTMQQRRSLFKALMREHWLNIIDSTDFVFAARLVKLNIWFYNLRDGLYEAYPDSTPGEKFVWPEFFYRKPEPIAFHGVSMWVPRDLNLYLKFRYGEDWKVQTYPNSKAWKSAEGYVFKWKHHLAIKENPWEVNQRWQKYIGTDFGPTQNIPT